MLTRSSADARPVLRTSGAIPNVWSTSRRGRAPLCRQQPQPVALPLSARTSVGIIRKGEGATDVAPADAIHRDENVPDRHQRKRGRKQLNELCKINRRVAEVSCPHRVEKRKQPPKHGFGVGRIARHQLELSTRRFSDLQHRPVGEHVAEVVAGRFGPVPGVNAARNRCTRTSAGSRADSAPRTETVGDRTLRS